jgi:hypothetical protein
MLIILLCKLLLVIFIYTTFFMFQVHKKNILSVHKLTIDNPIFIDYHSRYFLVKDWAMRNVLLRGSCKGGLYPWPSLEWSSSKCVFMITKPPVVRWHDRLGHPSMVIISRIVQENKLPCSSLEYNKITGYLSLNPSVCLKPL